MNNIPPQMHDDPERKSFDLVGAVKSIKGAQTVDDLIDVLRNIVPDIDNTTSIFQVVIESFIRFKFLDKKDLDWNGRSIKTLKRVNIVFQSLVNTLLETYCSDPSNILYKSRGLTTHELNHAFEDVGRILNIFSVALPEELDNLTRDLDRYLATSIRLMETLNLSIDMGSMPTLAIGDLLASINPGESRLVLQGNPIFLNLEEYLIIRTLIYNAITAAASNKDNISSVEVSSNIDHRDGVTIRTIEIADNVSPSWPDTSRDNRNKGFTLGSETIDPFPGRSEGLLMSSYRIAQMGGTIELIDNDPEGFKKIRITLPLRS